MLNISRFFLVFFFSVSAAYSANTTMPEYWSKTGISTNEYLNLFVRTCNSNKKKFVGCLAALNSLAKNFSTPAKLLPHSLVGQPNVSQGEMLLRLDPTFSLVKMPSKHVSSAAFLLFKQMRAETSAVTLRNEEIFNSVSATQKGINFLAYFMDFIERVNSNEKNKSKFEFILASSFNEYLKVVYDPHTYVAPADFIEDMMKSSDHKFSGVGLILGQKDHAVLVNSLVDGGSAKLSKKIKKGDILLKIKPSISSDWIDLVGKTQEEIISLIKGTSGTSLAIQFRRGDKTFEVTLDRKVVLMKNVVVNEVSDFNFRFGYIKLGSFQDESGCKKIAEAISQLNTQNVQGHILDLRGNTGGLVLQARCIAGLYMGSGTVLGTKSLKNAGSNIVYESSFHVDDYNQAKEGQTTRPAEKLAHSPVVVLIDAGSASASEIVAGALQDHKAAWIIGEPSFGKATVQALAPLPKNKKIIFASTVARFYQPSGRTNQITGIQPDFVVPFKPQATEEERFSPRESDLYANALEPMGKAWVQTRPQEIREIQRCRENLNWADRKFKDSDPNSDEEADYQVWVAQEVLHCSGLP